MPCRVGPGMSGPYRRRPCGATGWLMRPMLSVSRSRRRRHRRYLCAAAREGMVAYRAPAMSVVACDAEARGDPAGGGAGRLRRTGREAESLRDYAAAWLTAGKLVPHSCVSRLPPGPITTSSVAPRAGCGSVTPPRLPGRTTSPTNRPYPTGGPCGPESRTRRTELGAVRRSGRTSCVANPALTRRRSGRQCATGRYPSTGAPRRAAG